MKHIIRNFLSVLLIIAALNTIATPAYATPMLRLTTGVSSILIEDQTITDGNGAPGIVTHTGTLVTWNPANVTARTKPETGTPLLPHMGLSSIDFYAAGGTPSLIIEWTETDFIMSADMSAIPSMQTSGLITEFQNFSSSSFLYEAFLDPSNIAFANTVALGSLGPYVGQGTFNTSLLSDLITFSGPYSLTQRITLFADPGTTFNFFAGLDLLPVPTPAPVPEPSTFGLLGAGLAGLAAMGIRRRKS